MSANAQAVEDSRTLTFFHTHTEESTTVTFRRGNSYVSDGLKQLNHFLRDWRAEQSTSMDPRLFDIIWEVHRAVGSRSPVHIISAYRSPQTNQALRSRSRAVSEHSQHMLGKAMDIRFPDVDPGRIREAAMRVQQGGVGFYPGANFVHVDVGSVRAWPRMSREQLAQLFPDGKTVTFPRMASRWPVTNRRVPRSCHAARLGRPNRGWSAAAFGLASSVVAMIASRRFRRRRNRSYPASTGLCSLAAATAAHRP